MTASANSQDNLGTHAEAPIAIVGIGGLFPGAPDLNTFWGNIAAGIDSGRDVPPGRWIISPEQAYAPEIGAPDKVYSTWGCFIEGFELDPAGIGLDQQLLRELDPVYHYGLHATRAAIADASNLAEIDRSRVGVIIGNIALPTDASSALARRFLGRTFIEKMVPGASARAVDEWALAADPIHPLNRYVAGLPGGLIAAAFGLGAGAFTLDAACASSLYSLKLACDELRSGRVDAMIAGGMSRPDCLYTQMGFAVLKALSRSGRCVPLSCAADGLVVGEGAGIVVLKRLADAMRDGDHIYATIAGIGLSNDTGGSILAPDSEGQLRAMRSAYEQAQWRPGDVDLIECHATGTPVGDAVEINSLQQLWANVSARPGECVIGGVKSNVGHLLTGAGAAGLIKTLLAFKHGVLPPTANYHEPAPKLANTGSPFRVLAEAEDWRQPVSHNRRAAVSAFGFGGINAHVLLQQWDAASAPRATTTSTVVTSMSVSRQSEELAIIGIDAWFGPWNSLDAFRRRFLTGGDNSELMPPAWWGAEQSVWFEREGYRNAPQSGWFVDKIQIPFGRFRIPPVELQEMLPQQLLMLLVADRALKDAGISGPLGNRAGVFIGIGLDLNTTNFQVRWTLAESIPAMARRAKAPLGDEAVEKLIADARDAVSPPLTANRTMGALGGIVASRIAREFGVGGPSFTISSEETSPLHALATSARMLQQHEIDSAIVGGVDLAGDVRSVLATHQVKPFDRAVSEGAAAVIVKRRPDAERDGDLIYATFSGVATESGGKQFLASAPSPYPSPQGSLPAVRAGRGEGTRLSPPRQESDSSPFLPPKPVEFDAAEAVGDAGAAAGMASVVGACLTLRERVLPPSATSGQPEYWLSNRTEGPRAASVTVVSIDGNRTSVVLTESPNPKDSAICRTQLANHSPLPLGERDRVRGWRPEHSVSPTSDPTPILASPNPDIGNKGGKTAFVYPGSGNQFPGMGRELFVEWPHVLDRQHAENERHRDQLVPESMWRDESADGTGRDHKAMIFGQVSIGSAVTDLLVEFGIKPDAVIGYSLGESTALFATRAWRDRDLMLQKMHDATLFGSDLVAPFEAARRAWNIPSGQPVEWVSGILNRPADVIREAIATTERAYLLIINTPSQCVVGGDRQAVAELTRRVGGTLLPLRWPSTVHCEVLHTVREAYRKLHLLPTTAPADIEFYGGAWGRSFAVSQDSAADAIVAQALATVDFPAVIRQAYADGVRTFVEIGPGDSCSRMIREILADQPFTCHAILKPNSNAVEDVLQAVDWFADRGVAISQEMLADRFSETEPEAGKTMTISVGGQPFVPPLFSELKPETKPQTPPIESPSGTGGLPASVSTTGKQAATTTRKTKSIATATKASFAIDVNSHETPSAPPLTLPEFEIPLEMPDTDPNITEPVLAQFSKSNDATAAAHEAFLKFSHVAQAAAAKAIDSEPVTRSEPNIRLTSDTGAVARRPLRDVEVLSRANSALSLRSDRLLRYWGRSSQRSILIRRACDYRTSR